VYRNNVIVSLVDALAANFPVTRELVGEAFFRAMARLHAIDFPPRSPVLAWYGERFPAFIEGFGPAASVPYLADVARLELLALRAFHAADTPALRADAIASHLRACDSLAQATLTFHPSAAVLDSRFSIVSLWAAHQGLLDVAEVDPTVAQSALVARQGDGVAVIAIDRAASGFFRDLLDGHCLGICATEAQARDARFDPGAAIALLIAHGALGRWHQPGERQP
jgi:hypothetical protein